MLTPVPALAASISWNGTVDTDWSNPANWTAGVPTNADTAFVANIATNETEIGAGVNGTAGTIAVGTSSTGILTIFNGGTLATGFANIGSGSAGGLVQVMDAGSVWTNTGTLSIGLSGPGYLNILSGGAVNSAFALIGDQVGSLGAVTVDGAGSQFLLTGDLIAGYRDYGALTVSNGGLVSANYVYLGHNASGDGHVFVTGAGSTLNVSSGIHVGYGIEGDFQVLAGGTVTSLYGVVGNLVGAVGTATVDGAGSSWTTTGGIDVGLLGTGMLTVSNGGLVDAPDSTFGAGLTGDGTLIVDGAGSSFHAVNNIYLGQDGAGAATISDGALLASDAGIIIGQNAGSTGALNIGAAAGDAAAAAGDVSAMVVSLQLGSASLNFNHTDTAYTFANQITSFDATPFLNQIAGTTILTGDNSFFFGTTTITGGRLVVNGMLSGEIVVDGGSLGGSGSLLSLAGLAINSGGTLAPGNSIGTMNVAGDVTFNAGSVFEVEVDDLGNSDLLHAGLTATIDSGASVLVMPENGTDTGVTYADGSVYTILTADGGITGAFGSITDTFAFLAGTLSYDANNVYLTLNQVADFLSVARTPNQLAAAGGADALGAGNAVFDAALGLSVSQSLAAFDALSGEVHASIKGALVEDSRHLRRAALARTGEGAARPGFWATVYGATGAIDSDGNAAEIEKTGGGLIVGVDGEAGGWRIGGALHAGATDFDVDNRGSSGDSTDYGFAIYGSTDLGGSALSLGAGYTRHDISTDRNIAVGGFSDRAEADYSAGTAQVFGRFSRSFDADAVKLTPYAEVAHVAHMTDSYSETGGAAALSGASDTFQATFTTLGLQAEHAVAIGDTANAKLRGGIGWQHGFSDEPEAVNRFAGGNGFAVRGAALDGDTAIFDAGVDVAVGPATTFGLAYSGQAGSVGQDHALKLAFEMKF